MRRPAQTNFGSKQQTRNSRKAMAMSIACSARVMPTVEDLMRPPHSLNRAEATYIHTQASWARGIA